MGRNTLIEGLKRQAQALKQEVTALFLAYTRHRIPFWAKVVAIITVGYAVSPIDLIPDFIPLLGYLDDLVLLPLGIALAVRLIPPDTMAQCRSEAKELLKENLPAGRIAALVIVLIWAALGWVVITKLM